MVESSLGSLNYESFGSTTRESFRPDNRSIGIVKKAFLTRLVTRAADRNQKFPHDYIAVIIKLYSQMLTASVWLSALMFNTKAIPYEYHASPIAAAIRFLLP